MKLLCFILSLVFAIAFFSCSKSVDTPSEDWNEKLKNTAWSGEYAYTSGTYTKQQPFSILLAADGTLNWSDVGSTRPGGTWKCIGDKVTITFPNGTSFLATVSTGGWSNFIVPEATGITLNYIHASPLLKASDLINSKWDGDFVGSKATVRFVTVSKLEFTSAGSPAQVVEYNIESSGIRFVVTGLLYDDIYFGSFEGNGTAINGLLGSAGKFLPPTTKYFSWSAKKI